MLKQTSQGFRKIFLLSFTKQLIDTYAPEDIAKLERIIKKDEEKKADKEKSQILLKEIMQKKEKEEKIKKEIKEKQKKLDKKIEERENKLNEEIKKREEELNNIKKREEEKLRTNIKPLVSNLKESLGSLKKMRPVLRIPETRLPSTFQHLKPSPTNKEVDIGRLNIFLRDPLVKVIECHGPNQNIVVHGAMGVKPTKIVLSKEEIKIIIKNFSEAAKIPLDEGIFKAAIGKLIISAIISETVGSRFIIRKMKYLPTSYSRT